MNVAISQNSKEVQLFSHETFGIVRSIMINNVPWFVGRDVANALGYTNPKKALKDHVFEDDKMGERGVTPYVLDTMGRKQYPIWINESGVYALIFGSQLQTAKEFKYWVTSKVLPEIRKTGSYFGASGKLQELIDKIGNINVAYVQINNMENLLETQHEMLESVVDNMTLSTRQQQQIYQVAKDRINYLLGGAHSIEYKENAKSYFINLWNAAKENFECGSSYKDLNQKDFDNAVRFIKEWVYEE